MEHVDEAYDAKMAAFEVDCNDGNGEPVACHHVGEFFSVVKEERDRAAKVYEKNCLEKGYGPSCFNLGKLFLSGKGVGQSDVKAEEMFKRSCDKQHLQGCYHQAIMMYTTFEDILHPKSENAGKTKVSAEVLAENHQKQKEALKLFDWACKEGEIDSCYFAAGHHIAHHNAERNPKLAIDYFERSCKSNHAPSCYNLAVLYRNGDIGVDKDTEKFEHYKDITNKLVKQVGGLGGKKTN